MIDSTRRSYAVGVATLWLPLYTLAFLVAGAALVISQRGPALGDDARTLFVVVVPLHLVTMAISLALLVVYLVDVFRNPDLLDRQDVRIMWVVLVVVVSGFAMLVYWWLYLRPGGESFRRRLSRL